MSEPFFLVLYAIGAGVAALFYVLRSRLGQAGFRQLIVMPVMFIVLVAIADTIRLITK